jgi:Domain of unknown function (DUF4372)
MDHLPQHTFRRLVERYGGDRSVRSFSCQDQFRCMAFAQLTYRNSLRDTVTALKLDEFHATELAPDIPSWQRSDDSDDDGFVQDGANTVD